MFWGAILAALAVTFAAPMTAAAETLAERADRMAPHFTVTRPEAANGRTPVIVFMHGCGGRRPFLDDMARVASEAGAAVIDVDSYAHRRISRTAALATVCTGARLRGNERAGDLYAALHWARTQDWVDPDRMAAIGWSHGGWSIMDALALRTGREMRRATGISDLPEEPLIGLSSVMLVYPYAGIASLAGRRGWRVSPQTTAILARRDSIVGFDTPRRAIERQRARGANIDVHIFDDATHAFEDEGAEHPQVRYNPAATQREYELIRAMVAAL